jgi:hypothetical protein
LSSYAFMKLRCLPSKDSQEHNETSSSEASAASVFLTNRTRPLRLPQRPISARRIAGNTLVEEAILHASTMVCVGHRPLHVFKQRQYRKFPAQRARSECLLLAKVAACTTKQREMQQIREICSSRICGAHHGNTILIRPVCRS